MPTGSTDRSLNDRSLLVRESLGRVIRLCLSYDVQISGSTRLIIQNRIFQAFGPLSVDFSLAGRR